MAKKFLEEIFSVKNDANKKHKIIKCCGIKLKVKKDFVDYLKVMTDSSLYVGIPDNITLQMSFNNDCNCKCKFCSESIATDKSNRQVIPEKWLYEYMLPLYPKTSNIVPTYGEITYCKEGFEYLSWISKNYPHINIFTETNGIAFNDKWAQLASENLINMHFSINAINEDYFKKTVWEKDGVYSLVQNNFNHYLKVLEEKGLSAFKPSVSMVINSTNYETIVEFAKQYVSKGIQFINFYFDNIENETYCGLKHAKSSAVEEALITLIELDKVLNGKVHLFYRLFAPTTEIEKYDCIVEQKDINSLKEKYSDVLELAKDMDLRKLSEERAQIRKQYGKREYTYYEDLTGCTYHQKIHNGYSICSNPWNHLRLRPNGDYNYCSWTPYLHNLKKYIKNDKIDWKKFFNSYYYRKARKNFQKRCYLNCMTKFPEFECISQEELSKKYN